MDLLAQGTEDGEKTIDALLDRAAEIKAIIQKEFFDTSSNPLAGKTLEAVQNEFAKKLIASGKLSSENAEVSKLHSIAREQAVLSVSDFRKMEMWLAFKTPPVSDGNNFGVEVQSFVCTELKTMRQAMQTMVDGVSNYHWQRASALEKMGGESKESSTSESTEKDNDKTTVKSSTTSKTTNKDEPAMRDYVLHTAALDAREYHNVYCHLVDISNCYLKAHLLFVKNSKRLADPRGEGGDGRG